MIKYSLPLLFMLISSSGDAGKVKQPISIPNFDVKPSTLRRHVETLAKGPPRSIDHPKSLERAAKYIEKTLINYGYKVDSQVYSDGRRRFRNLIATLHSDKKPLIVIGAHYDVCGEQPGADDNASGIAGLIELARILKERKNDISYQIQFVAYSTEEPPYFRSHLMGSYVHAKSLFDQNIKPQLMIGLEMIGYFSDKKGSQSYPTFLLKPFYPNTGNFIAVVTKFGHRKYRKGLKRAFGEMGLKSRTIAAPSILPGIDFSDHLNYWKHGMKAMMITDTSFYRNRNYHQPTDTPDTLDYKRMAQVVKGLAHYLLKSSF